MKFVSRAFAVAVIAAASASFGVNTPSAFAEDASAPLTVPAPEDTVRFVEGVYTRKQAVDALAEGMWEADLALINETFSPELLAIFNAFMDTPEPVLNGDAFWGAQDWEITELAFAFTGTAEATTVTVSFKNFGEPRQTILTLIMLNNEWKIDNIGWDDGYDLRTLYKTDVEGVQPEPAPTP